jgi:hypothetical protein
MHVLLLLFSIGSHQFSSVNAKSKQRQAGRVSRWHCECHERTQVSASRPSFFLFERRALTGGEKQAILLWRHKYTENTAAQTNIMVFLAFFQKGLYVICTKKK